MNNHIHIDSNVIIDIVLIISLSMNANMNVGNCLLPIVFLGDHQVFQDDEDL